MRSEKAFEDNSMKIFHSCKICGYHWLTSIQKNMQIISHMVLYEIQ